jgi:integrase
MRAHRARQPQERLLAANLWQGARTASSSPTRPAGRWPPTRVAVAWRGLLRRTALSHVPFHALRHAATTLTVAANVAPKMAARRLGHASASLTLDRYHVTDDLERAAAAAVEAVLRQAGEPAPEEQAT